MPIVSIFVEGGGEAPSRKLLNASMSAFLAPIRAAFEARGFKWRPAFCGSRNEACKDFMLARRQAEKGDILILLVDAEGSIAPIRNKPDGTRETQKIQHLCNGRDERINLDGVEEDYVHVMAQSMETWLTADPEALAEYYGKGFDPKALPSRTNLEEVPKADCTNALKEAARDTQKGKYHKTQHAPHLLARIDREKVKARCPHARVLFEVVPKLING